MEATYGKQRLFWLLIGLGLCLGSAFCAVRWFALGVIAGKWVGLRGYEDRIQSTLSESQLWGIAALILPIVVAFLPGFIGPHGPNEVEKQTAASALQRVIRGTGRYAIRLFVSVLCVVIFVILLVFLAYLNPRLAPWGAL